MTVIEKLLKVTQIGDKFKKKEGKLIHTRRVEISDDKGKFKVIVNDNVDDLDSIFRTLDEDTDLHTEVDTHLDIQLINRQTRINTYDKEVKNLLDKKEVK
jgi:hypothetical protein